MCNSWLLFLQVVHHLIPRDPQREFSVKYSMSIQKWQGNRPCRQSPLYCNAPSADVVTLAIHVSRTQSILVRTYITTYNTPRAHSPHTPILNWRSIKTSKLTGAGLCCGVRRLLTFFTKRDMGTDAADQRRKVVNWTILSTSALHLNGTVR